MPSLNMNNLRALAAAFMEHNILSFCSGHTGFVLGDQGARIFSLPEHADPHKGLGLPL